MKATLGEFEFDLLAGPESLDWGRQFSFAEHAVIEKKSVLQWVGDPLETINIRIQLHTQFCEPEKVAADIVRQAKKHDPLPFTLDSGRYLGLWVIEEIPENWTHTMADGTIILMGMEIKLREWWDPEEESDSAADPDVAGIPETEAPDTTPANDPQVPPDDNDEANAGLAARQPDGGEA